MMSVKHSIGTIFLSVITLIAYNNCSGGSGFNASSSTRGQAASSHLSTPNTVTGTEANVVSITMNCNYINEPCVSVTICSPSGANCQTINNILLDTGSYGLRVFSSVMSTALSASLTPVTIGGGAI